MMADWKQIINLFCKMITKFKKKIIRAAAFSMCLLFICMVFPRALFGDVSDQTVRLTLEEAISFALRANRNLLFSAAVVESRNLSLSATESEFELKIRPSANAGIRNDAGSVGAGIALEKKFRIGTKASLFPRLGKSEDEYSGEIGLSLEIPLLRGFGKSVNENNIRQSEFSMRTAERSLYLTRNNIVLDTVSAVYHILRQKKLVRLFESQAEQFRDYADIAKIREKVALATPLDTYRAEIRLRDIENSLTLARETFRNAGDSLKLILAIPMESHIEVSAPIESGTADMGLEDAVKLAFSNRAELEQARDEMGEAGRTSDIAKHNLLPRLNLVVNYERYGDSGDFGRAMAFDEERWSIHFAGSTDVSRSSEKATFQQSLIKKRTTRLNLEAKQAEIQREVRGQLEALRKSEERIRIRKEQIRHARGKLELAKIKFNHGMANNFDIIEAETELRQARVYLLSVKTEYIVGTYRLRAALGTLLER